VPLVGDFQVGQPGLPRWFAGELLRPLGQLGAQRCRQLLPFPVGQGGLVDRVVALRPLQDLQKVQPAFAVGALEVGKQVVADHGAKTVLALVTRAGVVRADERRLGQPHRQHLGLLLVKGVFILGQDAVQLARRNVDVVLPQLLQQQRLGDPGLMILVDNVDD
jgi:hypothetical protein